jgi:multidrug efflux pump
MFSKFFIERPIFAIVVSLLISIGGLVSLKGLPIEQYPNMSPVQVTVAASYPGADAKTVAESVASPIEAQINGVDNMMYMSSTSSSTGQMQLTVYFSLDTDPDIAQVQVQNRVSLAQPQLPAAVVQNGVAVQKRSSSILMLVGIYGKGDRYSPDYVANYANVYVLDALKRVPGAGQASIMGVADQAMRIWMNPDRMASLKITTSDIQTAVANQNKLFSAGLLGQQPNPLSLEQTFPLVTQGPFTEPRQYENIILRASQDGSAIVRLKDVARVEVGRSSYPVDSTLNGAPATFIAIYQQAGANALEVSDAVRKALEDLKAGMPEGMEYRVALDTTDFVRLSIEEVLHTLLEAVLLVVGVIYLFLQNVRATIIATTAIFVALLGTFVGMLALGFSINLLTLFGMVLAIGIVVDDAIIVVENVERNMAQAHLSAREATIKAMSEVSGPVVAVVFVLAAVFIPAAFLPGTTGQLYKQFAITIAISVAISGFVALTLTPAMCGMMLKHVSPPQKGFFAWFNRKFESLTKSYGRLVATVIRRIALSFAFLAIMVVAIFGLFRALPGSFVPNEDQGYVLAAVIMPDAASLDRVQDVMNRVNTLFEKNPAVLDRTEIAGFSLLDNGFKTNAGTFFVTLKDFKERYKDSETAATQSADAVINAVRRQAAGIEQGLIVPISPPPIPGLGTTGGFEFWIQDTTAGSPDKLQEAANAFVAKARARPELAGLTSTFRASSQQLRVDVNRDKAKLLGVDVTDVYGTLQAQFGSAIVSQFNQFSRVWYVILQSEPRYRIKPDDVTRLYTRSSSGQMIPLSSVVTTRYVTGPDLMPHFNGFPSAKINGNAAAGYSSGQAIAVMEEVARETLPAGFRFAWSGLAYEEKKSGGTSTVAFAFGLLLVFLILAAQYESWTLPGAVVTAVPFGIVGALLATWLRGLDNDVYFQIGLLVLVGLAAKNAILIVEFAVELNQKEGKSLVDSAIEAGELRLRPIIMTSLAFIGGVIPLALASGAGANARHSIGTGIIGGMIGASTLALIFVPLFFVLFERFAQRGDKSAPAGGAAAEPGTDGHGSGTSPGAAAPAAAPAKEGA